MLHQTLGPGFHRRFSLCIEIIFIREHFQRFLCVGKSEISGTASAANLFDDVTQSGKGLGPVRQDLNWRINGEHSLQSKKQKKKLLSHGATWVCHLAQDLSFESRRRSKYSGGSKSELGIPNAIPIPNILKFGFRMDHSKWIFQNGRFSLGHFISLHYLSYLHWVN